MDNSNESTEASGFSGDRSCDATVELFFAQRFPTLELQRFVAFRKGSHYTSSCHIVCLTGMRQALLDSCIIDESMLPPGRKRTAHGHFRHPSGFWHVRLMRASRIEFDLHIADDDALPAEHPLQIFHPRRWPFGQRKPQTPLTSSAALQAAAAPLAELARIAASFAPRLVQQVLHCIGKIDGYIDSEHGLIAERENIRREVVAARPHLRLVVDNDAGPVRS